MPQWRELTQPEVKRLLKKKNVTKVYDVVYKGLPASKKDLHVRRFTMQHIQTKVVDEDSANILIRHGWEIIEIYDPDEEDE